MLLQTDIQTNRFLADSYIPSTFQIGENEIQQKVLMICSAPATILGQRAAR